MAKAFHSPYWYRLENLKPQLPVHVKIARHDYRGQPGFIVQDAVNNRHLRLSPAARFIVGRMNGVLTVQQLWDQALTSLDDMAPGQEEMIQLLGSLYEADMLRCDIAPDSDELLRRYRKHTKQEWRKRWMNPLAIRFPLLDPERFLTCHLAKVSWLFTRTAAVLITLLIMLSLAVVSVHWTEISQQMMGRVLQPDNLLLLFLVYPCVKILHEFGHAFATRYWGGEVHEMGITLLVMMPIPYVDASSANVFPDKYQRMVVGAAGMIVEWILASIAVLIWLNSEPGLVKNICWDVMLISGFSTLFFNGNPLLKFDGYYILSDAIEIPNLDKRAKAYLGYLTKRYLLGTHGLTSPAYSRGERRWLAGYGLLSTVYRLAILFTIIIFIMGKYFIIGVLLAAWALFMQCVMPLYKKAGFLLSNSELNDNRMRALVMGMVLPVVLVVMLFTVPFPDWTRSEGVIWLPEKAHVRAQTDGFVEQVLVAPDSLVKKGDALIKCIDREAEAQVSLLQAQIDELETRYRSSMSSDRLQAKQTQEKIRALQANMLHAREKTQQLVIRSAANGRFVVTNADDLLGIYIRQGDLLGFVIEQPLTRARVVVRQKVADQVRQMTESVELRLVNQPNISITAQLEREIPAASNQLPSQALGANGGGDIAIDTTDEKGLTASESVFQFELSLLENRDVMYSGGRVFVRFNHGREPLGQQWARRLQQILVKRIDV
ncbi:MAG: hypothetical protein V3W04_15950 [Gammaproteobacteria bacterium]